MDHAGAAMTDLAIPLHYNTFPVIRADPEEFKRQVEAIGKKAVVMGYGEERAL